MGFALGSYTRWEMVGILGIRWWEIERDIDAQPGPWLMALAKSRTLLALL